MNPRFLTVDQILQRHRQQIQRFGGAAGLRDRRLLESAVAQPQTTFADRFVHTGLFEMGAAYLFHIARNHPFVDGKKRTSLASAIVFLRGNGVPLRGRGDTLYDLTIGAAAGRIDKAGIASTLREVSGGEG